MGRKRVLVVDDNHDLAENLAEILEEAGFAADVFVDPREAIAALEPHRYAVAVLDIRMPVMDGVDLYRALKARDPAMPAIAMTAFADDDRIRAAIDEGVIAVLPKPLDVPRLLARLSSVVGGEKALVVEDDVDLAANLVEVLAERGFSARAVHGCDAARTVLRASGPVSVLLVDYRLPDGDGLELVDEFCRGTECTAVVFSGYMRELSGARESRDGVRFFEKPLDLTRLLAALGPPKP